MAGMHESQPVQDKQIQIGQVWMRRDGTTFQIHSINRTHVWYWLAEGSHPQYRPVRKDLLIKNYTLVE